VIITVSLDSTTPLYQQIRDRIVEAVADGQLRAGDPLPSIRQLASDLGINFHTVNKGYDALRAERLLRLTRKSGAVVQRDPGTDPPEPGYPDDWASRARTLLAEAIAHGMPADEVIDRCRQIVTGFQATVAPGPPAHSHATNSAAGPASTAPGVHP
jgi:GntR family transcriptional regulator